MLRSLLRQILFTLSRLVLRKHQPTIIAILGTGQTSIIREAVYAIVSTKYPARRNVELPESEFSIPLTVLAYPNYPHGYLEWLWVIVKTAIQLITVRAYKHYLVLELTALSADVLEYWLQITNPQYTFKVEDNKLEDLKRDAQFKRLCQDLLLDDTLVDKVLSNLRFPEARIDVYAGPGGSLVVDSTYYYFPIRLESVLEVARELGERVVVLSTDKQDYAQSAAGVSTDNGNYSPGDVIVLRGHKTDVLKSFQKFIKQR